MSSKAPNTSLRSNLIGDRKFYAAVLAIVLPIIVQNTVTNVVSLLDNVMVGRVGTLEMSAVAIANQLLFVFSLCIFGALAGAGIFAAQFAGAGDNNGVRYCFRIKVILSVVISLAAIGIFYALPEVLVSQYLTDTSDPQAVEKTLGLAVGYLRIMLVGLPAFALCQAYASTLREVGETKLPMIASIVAIFVNLIFNYLLIFGQFGFPQLGVAGAAIATVLSRYVELAIIVIYTHARHKKFVFIERAFRSLYIPRRLCLDVTKRGMPLLINEFLWSAGMATLMQCYSVRGLDVVAASNISSTVSNIFNVVFLSMGNAVAIMVGQALGANEPERAKQTAWRLIALASGSSLFFGGLLALASPIIPNLYNTEPEVRALATSFIIIVACLMPVFAFAHCCYFTLRSGGKTIITFIFDSAFTWLVNVAVAYSLAHFTNMPIVPLFLCIQMLDLLKCLVGYIMIRKGVWIQNIVEDTISE